MKTTKIISAVAAILLLPTILMVSGASAGDALTAIAEFTRNTAYLAAGFTLPQKTATTSAAISEKLTVATVGNESQISSIISSTSYAATTSAVSTSQTSAQQTATTATAEVPQPQEKTGIVISRNIEEYDDELDYTSAGTNSGSISRVAYGKYSSSEYITLASGAQVRNCTYDSNDSLLKAAQQLPDLDVELYSDLPQVLIVHTHATESYEPYQRNYFDSDFPSRSRDPRHNMIAVGEVLAQTLADNGISVIHDGTLHDYPSYTGSYDRSEDTIRATLEKYPSIKIIIDLHRDAMIDSNGSRIAPTIEINGRSAAQFMIISGCDDGRFNMPDYIENFKLAALLQNSSEVLYPGLARAVLFDYRNYNQHITTGSLLIEVGSHANSLDEALYTAELLGESMAAALAMLS